MAPIPADLTPEQVYERMEAAMQGDDGDILHASIVLTGAVFAAGTPFPTPEGYDPEDYGTNVWIDATNQVARVDTRVRLEEEEPADRVSREITRDGQRLSVDHDGRSTTGSAVRCPGDSVMAAVLVNCRDPFNTAKTVVEQGEYEDSPAIVLLTEGESESDDSKLLYTVKTYVDPDTYLPRGAEHRLRPAAIDSGGDFDQQIFRRYDIEFVDRSSLPADFFEPQSIGHVERPPVPADNLQTEVKGMRVYWLGSQFDAAPDRPLKLQQPNVYAGEFSPGPLVQLSYAVEGDETGYRGVGIREYPRDVEAEAESEVQEYWTGQGITEREIDVGGASVRLYENATDYGELYRAHMYFGTTLVVVQDYLGAPPYTGRDAFMRVLAELRPYE